MSRGGRECRLQEYKLPKKGQVTATHYRVAVSFSTHIGTMRQSLIFPAPANVPVHPSTSHRPRYLPLWAS